MKGRLPCDANLLRERARQLQLLDPLVPQLRLRQLLSASPHTLLAHDPQLLLSRATIFAALLPMYDTTHVLMTVMPHLGRDPRVTAANFLDLDDVFGRAFGGARVPPSVFAHILRAPGATLMPPPPVTTAAAMVTAAAPRENTTGSPGRQAHRAPAEAGAPAASDVELGGTAAATSGRGYPAARQRQQEQQQPHPQPPQLGQRPVEAEGSSAQQQHIQQQQQQQQQQQDPASPSGGIGSGQTRDSLVLQRRHVNAIELLRRLQELILLFGRETAYVAVQRHPPLLERDPRDLASRAAQLLAAVDPRVGGAAAAMGGLGAAAARGAACARPLAHVLEDAPEALDLDLGEVRGRLRELSTALDWSGEQVAQLVLHDPRVILRDPVACRENVARLRLYSLRRPATWARELPMMLGSGAAPAAAPSTTVPAATAAAAAASATGLQSNHYQAYAAAAIPRTKSPRDRRGGEAAADGATVVSASCAPGFGFGSGRELDAELLSLVARILSAPEEVIDRFEYLVITGERGEATIRELVYESRVKFVRQCPRYSRWWAEAVARQRGEGGGAFGLGSGLERGCAEEVVDGEMEGADGQGLRQGLRGAGGTWDADAGDGWAEGDDGAERILGPDAEAF